MLLTSGIIDPDGYVTNSKTGLQVVGAQVILKSKDPISGDFVDWDAVTYLQVNPQLTDSSGFYRFYVPPGQYKLEVKKRGYFTFVSDVITVVDAPVRVNVQLEPWLVMYLPIALR